jgi:hypothetical protein
VPLNSANADKWEFADADYTFETFLGQDAIVLKKGLVLVKDSAVFVNRTIEFDIIYEKAYDLAIEKDFGGGAFRAQSLTEYEVVHSRDNNFGTTYGLHYFPIYDGQKETVPFEKDLNLVTNLVNFRTFYSYGFFHFKIIIATHIIY